MSEEERPAGREYRHRRAPRYRAFGVTGAVVGALVGIVLALARPVADNFSTGTIVGYFAAVLGLIGALVGLGVALVVERRR